MASDMTRIHHVANEQGRLQQALAGAIASARANGLDHDEIYRGLEGMVNRLIEQVVIESGARDEDGTDGE